MTERKLNFVLVGCGHIGKKYLELLPQISGAELTAVIDKGHSSLVNGKKYLCFNSLEEYFHSGESADLMIIATPNGTHAPLAIKALRQKIHVLIEKPLALKTADAETIIETAKAVNRKAMVVLQNRFAPISVWLKQLVQSGKLGKLFFVEVNCFWNRDERYYHENDWRGTAQMDGGTLFTQFSHFIDLLYWLFGDITNISSRFQNYNHPYLRDFEDTGSIQFNFKQGGMGSFNFTTAVWDKSMESSIAILAEKGTVKVCGQYMDRIEYCHIKEYSLPQVEIEDAMHNHFKMLQATIKTIREDGNTNVEDAFHSVDIIQRMYAAAGS